MSQGTVFRSSEIEDILRHGGRAKEETPAELAQAPHYDDFVDRLKSECVVTRYEAAQELGTRNQELQGARRELLASLVVSDESRLVRYAAARALGTLGPAVSPHTAVLVQALQDSEMLVRRDAAKAIANLSAEALKPHLRALATALEDEFWPVRLWACKSLSTCGPLVVSTVPYCPRKIATMALSDSEDAVRDMAAKVLPCLGSSAVPHVQWFVEMLLSKRQDDHSSACRALANILSGPDEKARNMVKEALQPVIQSAEDQVRERLKIQVAKGSLKDHDGLVPSAHEAIAALETALEDEDWQIRFRAVEELRAMAVC